MARFALMHLLGTAISLWLDTIVDEVIDDFVDRRLSEANATNMEDSFEEMLAHYDEPFYDHLVHSINCSKLAIVSNQSMSALPYFYPFTIEFNIAIASIWYMIWTNIGKKFLTSQQKVLTILSPFYQAKSTTSRFFIR